MLGTSKSFSLLQATAAIVAMTIVLWSLGLPSLQFVNAANVTTFSDTLSTSEPSVASNHTITFTTPSGVDDGETIVIDFTDGTFDDNTVDFEDLDVSVAGTGDLTVEASCTTQDVSAAFVADVLTITFCGNGASIGLGGTTTIEIGTNATSEVSGASQLTNPAAGSHKISVTAGAGSVDTGETQVAILAVVTVTASVDTLFTFTVAGVAGGQTVNGTTTGATTTATSIPFGLLNADTASTGAQDLSIVTNARNGFVVTVSSDGQLDSTNGADIDGFRNGNYDTTAVPWESPSASVGSEETYGHWGITSDDPTTAVGLIDRFDVTGDGQDYVSASTTPVEVFRHTGPTDGTTTGEGTTRVGYTIEISSLQEAADDYTAVLTYIATPVF
jgi:hypothetical protein